jgi:hypothetical protein
MATHQGTIFGEDKPVQRNKESTGDKPNRSPGESNAARLTPSVNEDLGKSLGKDIERIGKGMEPTGKSALTRSAQENAAGRAITRTAGRAGYAGAALEAGWDIGRAIDEETGAGKKIVDDSQVLKSVASKLSDSDKVSLSKEAKERIAEIENDKAMRDVDSEKEASKYGKGDNNFAKGGLIVNKGIGASMKAHNGFTSKGKK